MSAVDVIMGQIRSRPVRFDGLKAASRSSAWVKGRNRAADTLHERVLRSALWRRGLRFRKNVRLLTGTPDVVFAKSKVVLFCDGDFWHGRRWSFRKAKLRAGSNASYWIAKIEENRRRDAKINARLRRSGWYVIRVWETDVLRRTEVIAAKIETIVRNRVTAAQRVPLPLSKSAAR
jgi:DNA mismatch endonuclease, patch repair protein